MIRLLGILLLGVSFSSAADFSLNLTTSRELRFSAAPSNSIVSIFESSDLTAWTGLKNFYADLPGAGIIVTQSPGNKFFKARAVPLSPTREGFTNLIQSYGLLTTIAGAGGSTASANKWQAVFEGGPATNALLSRPHIAMADTNGNTFVADKDAHAIRKILPDGRIITVAGTGQPGNGTDEAATGTTVAMTEPNGLWVSGKGIVYILDLGNGKVRKLGPMAKTRTVFTVPGGILSGRGLWVNDAETLAYVSSGDRVLKWTSTGGITTHASGFSQLGNLAVDAAGLVYVTDRNAHRVFRIEADGTKTLLAGNGTTAGGGDGQLATATGLNQVRAIWLLPHGGILLGTDAGSQLWYLDKAGIIHLLLNGSANHTHAGDGTWFYAPSDQRLSKIRQVTMDHQGNILITEHDSGYVRLISFSTL